MRYSRVLLVLGLALCAVWISGIWRGKEKPPRPAIQSVVAPSRAPEPAPPADSSAPAPGSPAVTTAPGPNAPPTTTDAAPDPAAEIIRGLRQDLRWRNPITEPAFVDFRAWTDRYAAATTPEQKTQLTTEGLALAQQRRGEMVDLIEKDPRRALELAVPATVRRQLPPDVVAQLEEPIAGRGDLWVAAAVPAPGRPLSVRPVQRELIMKDGRSFDAFTFGKRDLVPTKMNIAVQGIALDGKAALTEMPGRVLEPVEVQDLHAKAGAAPVCPTSGEVTVGQTDEVVVDWDGDDHTFFCGPAHAVDAMVAASGDESIVSGDTSSAPPAPPSTYTEGTKKMLIIRVDFPDAPGQVVSDTTLTSLINNMASHWTEMSFGKLNWTTVGAGSAFTPTLRLPNGHASYTGFGTMLAAARSAATAAGFDYRNYNFEVVVTGDKPDVGFGGIAYVGGRGAWLANGQWNLGVCSHEVGHNFGLNHAGFWDTDDGTTTGSGSAVEYGNPFDSMGGASSSTDAHFGARQKNYLDWIADTDVVKITANGTTTTRIRAFDRSAATGVRALAVDRTGTSQDYWIEYRQDYADTNLWMRDGVVLNWGDVTINNGKPLLLDFAAGTSSKDDVPVLIGRTFSDTTAGIHITPVLRGADANGTTWIDVTVNRGPFTGNRKPAVTMAATDLNPAVNTSVTFTAAASDPDGDTLAYSWDWGDGTFTANNLPSASKSWSTSGARTVRCRVSDMKGLVATGQVLVQVGTTTTFFIQGTITTTAGASVENAVVRASATQSDTTDSEGYFAITGLTAGSYTLSATKTGLAINPSNFTNPVTVGPSQQNVNFTAPPGAPYFSAMKPGLLDQGSNTGAVVLPVLDPDSPVTSLTLTGTSSNTAIIPNASITFGTVGTTVRTVTAAAASNVSGPVDLTITATDPEGGTNSYVWRVVVNARPALTVTTQTTAENTFRDIDLRAFVADDLTADELLSFELQRVRNGTVTLLPDGYTARFTPSPNYNGPASFRVTARDRSLGPRVLFLYDFEPPDLATDARSTDVSNFNRVGTLEVAGVGGEYAYTPDVPPVMAPANVQSLSLSENTTGGARLRRTLATTDQNLNDADWSFSTWVKRSTRDTEDFIFHLGTGDGHGTEAELELYFGANSDTLRLQKWGSGGLEKEIVGPDLSIGVWRHITVVYDRSGTNIGNFTLYVDGFLMGSVTGVAMNVSQTAPLVVGAHSSTTSALDRWFDGRVEDVLFQSGLNSRAEIWGLSRFSSLHFNGLSTTATLNVNVTGVNQPPAISNIPNQQLPVSGTSGALAFTVRDAEVEARNVTVAATTSNPAVLPLSGIVVSPAPAAWTSSDIGTVGAAGSLIEDRGTFLVGGAGADIWGTSDEFRYVRQSLSGDGEIIARVASVDFTNQDAKAGVMMRSSTAAGSAYALACVTPGSGVTFQYRATDGGTAAANAVVNRVAAPCWVRLVRVGGNFTAFHATDDNGTAGPWQALGTTQPITFAAAPNLSGLAVSSKVDATVCTAVFDQLGGTVRLGGERSVTLTPVTGVAGSATVTLTASDGAASTVETFNVMVGTNTAPSISAVSNVTTTDGAAIPPFNVTLSDVHTPPENLTFTVTTSNPAMLPVQRVLISGSGGTRTLTLQPIASEIGTVSVFLQASDGSLIGNSSFTVTVQPGDPTMVVRRGANWRYFATGGSPGAAWTSAGFNDTAWVRAPGKLGYGDGDESTLVPSGPAGARFITTYFRRTIQIPSPALLSQAALRLRRDDGVVVYLNGVELFRDNMPAGAITTGVLALNELTGAAESAWLVHRFDPARLLAGANTLAVEVHQASAATDDMSFDAELLAFAHTAVPTLSVGLQSGNVQLRWPSWAIGWQLRGSPDFQAWQIVPGTAVDNGAGELLQSVPALTAPRFFRLEAP